jgi:hypothetical protein
MKASPMDGREIRAKARKRKAGAKKAGWREPAGLGRLSAPSKESGLKSGP